MECQLKDGLNNSSEKTCHQLIRVIQSGGFMQKYKVLSNNVFVKYKRIWANNKRFHHSSGLLRKKRVNQLKQVVLGFLSEDSNSRLCPGKNDVVTRKKEKKQKRLLSATMKELHGKFLKLHPDISYAAFCKCRPFWIVYPSVTNRNTCLCVTCSNFEFLVKKLHTLKIIKENSGVKLLQDICCQSDGEMCLFRKCNACANKLVCYEDFELDEDSSYTQWKTVKEPYIDSKGNAKSAQKVKAVEIPCKIADIVNLLEASLPKYMSHQANKMHQYLALKLLKETLANNEAIIHIDFSENYSCKYGEEVQSLHFGGSRQQITLHTGVIYSRVEGAVHCESFCTMSDSLNHGPPAIWAHLEPILKTLSNKSHEIDVLHFMSDGPATQYRNKTMFHIITHHLASSFLPLKSVTWNFSEAGHGKGAPDGIGGTVKRTADRLVAMGDSIPNFAKFVELMKKSFDNITLHTISKEAISKKEQILDEDTTVVQPFKGTMKVHQLSWHKGTQAISFRTLSCFACKAGEECEHYGLAVVWHSGKTVPVPEEPSVESDGLYPLSSYFTIFCLFYFDHFY